MAAAMWRRAAELGAPPGVIRVVRAGALRGRLAALLDAARGAEAPAIAAETIALQPANGVMLRWVGRLLLRGGQPEMARLAFERMVRAQPGNADGWLGLVEALDRQGAAGARTEAAKAARAALAHEPNAVPALARIARIEWLAVARGHPAAARVTSGA